MVEVISGAGKKERTKIIVHVGMNKTETGTFQNAMMQGAAVIQKGGVPCPVRKERQLGGGHHNFFLGTLDADTGNL